MTAEILRADVSMMANLISELDVSPSYESREILYRAASNSEPMYMGMVDSTPICFYGLIPPTIISDTAYLWLYTLPTFKSFTFIFIRHSQRVVEDMLKQYPRIIGHGQVGHERSLAWLKFLGAKFGEPQGKFLPFEITPRAA